MTYTQFYLATSIFEQLMRSMFTIHDQMCAIFSVHFNRWSIWDLFLFLCERHYIKDSDTTITVSAFATHTHNSKTRWWKVESTTVKSRNKETTKPRRWKIYGGTKVTCVCFYLSRAHEILCRGHEITKAWPRDTMSWPRDTSRGHEINKDTHNQSCHLCAIVKIVFSRSCFRVILVSSYVFVAMALTGLCRLWSGPLEYMYSTCH
jgi:hypothetical protein